MAAVPPSSLNINKSKPILFLYVLSSQIYKNYNQNHRGLNAYVVRLDNFYSF